MEAVAFLAAMKLEARPFLRLIGSYRRGSIGPFTCYRFHVCGRPCVLVVTGVGRRRAAEAARSLLSQTTPRLVVAFGIAGAPREGLRIGDVVLGRDVCELRGRNLASQRPLAEVSPSAWQAAQKAVDSFGARMVHGHIISTWGEQTVDSGGSENPVLEMETAAIDEVCAERGVPLLALRSISDSTKDPLPFRLAEFLDPRQQLKIAGLVSYCLWRPSLLPALLRLWRNACSAAQGAASAVVAAVTEEVQLF